MNEHQRQLVLLVAFMLLLSAVFVFLIEYAPEALEISPQTGSNQSIQGNISLPEPLNSSVNGLKQLYNDSISGLSAAVESGQGS